MLLCLFAISFSFLISSYGYGYVFLRILKVDLPRALFPIVGICLLVVAGGLLNFFSIACAVNLFIIFAIGIGVSIFSVFRIYFKKRNLLELKARGYKKNFKAALPYISAVFIFVLYTVLFGAPTAFNCHDDFEKYFKYPVRMLATGSLSSGYFDALGTEAIGAMSYLQGFLLLFGPYAYMNAMDSVIAPFIGLCLLSAALGRFRVHWAWRMIAPLPFVFIDPQIVNISSTYMGAAVWIFIFTLPLYSQNFENIISWKKSALYGMGYATVVVLKTSNALFVSIYYLCFTIFFMIYTKSKGDALKKIISIPLFSFACAFPWFLVHGQKFLSILSGRSISSLLSLKNQSELNPQSWNPFSTDDLFYGFEVCNLNYTTIVVLIVISGFYFSISKYYKREIRIASVTIAASCLIVYVLSMWKIAPSMSGYNATLRYVVPYLIASSTALTLCAVAPVFCVNHYEYAFSCIKINAERIAKKRGYIPTAVFCIMLGGGLIIFAPSFFQRLKHGLNYGNALPIASFSQKAYMRYCAEQQSERMQYYARKLQQLAPRYERILVWTLFSYHLDYARNDIIDVDPAGLTSPWLKFPFRESYAHQLAYLRNREISFLIIQYGGICMRATEYLEGMKRAGPPREREIAERTLIFRKFLQRLWEDKTCAVVLYADKESAVIQLKMISDKKDIIVHSI